MKKLIEPPHPPTAKTIRFTIRNLCGLREFGSQLRVFLVIKHVYSRNTKIYGASVKNR